MLNSNWNTQTYEVIEDLVYKIPERIPNEVRFRDFESLPDPVARYLRLALTEGQPQIEAVRLTQSGQFRTGLWFPFQAEQYVSTNPVSFVWNATIRMAGLIPMKVRDAYLEGNGSMLAKVFGIFPFLHQQDAEEINIAALQRYLAESVWYPSALLPSDRLIWTQLDYNRAVATLKDGKREASLEFDFNDRGEIETTFTPGRYRYEDGKFVLTPWIGYYTDYRQLHGMRIPMKAEVEWILPENRRFPYFKGNLASIEFNGDVFARFSPSFSCSCESL
jgi:hypothetical protein